MDPPKDHRNIKVTLNLPCPVRGPKIIIRDSAVDSLCHGANLAVPGVVEIDSDIKKDDLAAVFTLKGEGVALVKALMSTEEIVDKDKGECVKLERVFMDKGTYPDFRKKS